MSSFNFTRTGSIAGVQLDKARYFMIVAWFLDAWHFYPCAKTYPDHPVDSFPIQRKRCLLDQLKVLEAPQPDGLCPTDRQSDRVLDTRRGSWTVAVMHPPHRTTGNMCVFFYRLQGQLHRRGILFELFAVNYL
jgi:hypothetical protein